MTAVPRVVKQDVTLHGVEIHEMSMQPDQVEARLAELSTSLLLAIGIVALVVLLFMGPRLGFVVASVVPLVGLAALGLYAMGGGSAAQQPPPPLAASRLPPTVWPPAST